MWRGLRRAVKEEGSRTTRDSFTDEAIAFMEKKREEPVFVYLAYHAVHSPFEAKPELVTKYKQKGGGDAEYAATVEAVD